MFTPSVTCSDSLFILIHLLSCTVYNIFQLKKMEGDFMSKILR